MNYGNKIEKQIILTYWILLCNMVGMISTYFRKHMFFFTSAATVGKLKKYVNHIDFLKVG